MEQIRKKIKPRIRVIPPVGLGPRVWECHCAGYLRRIPYDKTPTITPIRPAYGSTPKIAYVNWVHLNYPSIVEMAHGLPSN